MATKLNIFIILVLVSVTSIFSTCKKGGILGCTISSEVFNVDARVYPDNDSIKIGDTLFVEISSPTTLINQYNEKVDYSGADNLVTNIGFVRVVNDSPVVVEHAVANFDFYSIAGREIPSAAPDLLKEYFLEETGGRYLFKLAIVAKNSGIFRLGIENAIHVMRHGSSCPKADFHFILKNTTDQHYYLYPGGAGVEPQGEDYYFYVR